MVLEGSTENAEALPILEIDQNGCSIGFSMTQSIGNYPESSSTFQNKCTIFWEISCIFFSKKIELYE